MQRLIFFLFFISLLHYSMLSENKAPKKYFDIGFGLNFLTPFFLDNLTYLPYGVTERNYALSNASSSANLKPYESSQYTGDDKNTEGIITDKEDLTILMFDLNFFFSLLLSPNMTLRFHFDFLFGNRGNSTFSKYMILLNNNASQYTGIVDVTRNSTFSTYGLYFGPEFIYRFSPLKNALPISFFIGTGLQIGGFFYLVNHIKAAGNVSFLPSGNQSIHTQNNDIKNSGDFLGDGIVTHSRFNENLSVQYRNPISTQFNIKVGLETTINEMSSFEFYLGFMWTYLYIQNLLYTVERTVNLSGSGEEIKQSFSFSQSGFHRHIPSFYFGLSLFFKTP